MRPRSCLSCRHRNAKFECHRRPPQVIPVLFGLFTRTAWPQVEETHWCAGYEPDLKILNKRKDP